MARLTEAYDVLIVASVFPVIADGPSSPGAPYRRLASGSGWPVRPATGMMRGSKELKACRAASLAANYRQGSAVLQEPEPEPEQRARPLMNIDNTGNPSCLT
ncbi:hypothetical protein ACFOEY_09510 [Paracandidimonas soli]|uniref:hypothetical protein n=1 Tax=Paracandidimonas soli TaxID=1917182 RepID=UPI003605D476